MAKDKKAEEPKEEKDESVVRELEDKIAELTSGWQRTQADFLNYKKQVQEERIRLIKTANASLIESILPVMDNFALAAKHLPEDLNDNAWAQGVKQIEKQLENVLADEGLEKIDSLGQQFNPELHEAIEDVESDQPEGTITEEVSPGFTYHGLVLRPAKVKVSKGK